ncbi:GNAT family N-acetyltransferase [Stenotrophomonas sp. Iso1]|uniref:GNAT family N-acetyltransferase n=1 Tax=Stenotrophomonas sp. Iso1 TaxID=2977283 RepID=UPI0022B79882|nr:GNAT family N-acetyltransferase [Stenotrophomonas sp. Iso1]
MHIRPLTHDDLDTASSLCMAAFMASVAPTLGDEGIATFQKIAAADAFAMRKDQDNVMLLAEVANQVIGLIELKQGRHIAMLFIAPGQQRSGVGRRLVAEALNHARGDQVTVSASLPSVPAYLSYGFHCSGDVAESAGLVYQPMERRLLPQPERG